MNFNNPYQSPEVDPLNRTITEQQASNLVATTHAINRATAAKGWVRFLSVMGFVYFGFIVLGIVFIGFSALQFMGSAEFLPILLIVLGGYIIFKLSMLLSNYSSAMGRLAASSHPQDFEDAMVIQLKFWRYAGILSIVYAVVSLIGYSFA